MTEDFSHLSPVAAFAMILALSPAGLAPAGTSQITPCKLLPPKDGRLADEEFREVKGIDVRTARYHRLLLLLLTSASCSGLKCPRYCSAVCQPMRSLEQPTRHNIGRTNKVLTSSIVF